MNYKNIIAISILLVLAGCQKSIESIDTTDSAQQQGNNNNQGSDPAKKNILVDASKDGGVWWFPQSPETGFSADADHQGKALADYLRAMGYQVGELPRGAVITDELLSKYDKIIRGPSFFDYSDAEVAAYDHFLSRAGALMILQDHLMNSVNDKLSAHLGLDFAGVVSGTVTNFTPHEITNGVTSIYYVAGSGVTNVSGNSAITVLGAFDNNSFLDLNNNEIQDPGEISAPAVMGTLNNYPYTKIFFLGDTNCLEALPQPLTQNIIQWLFE